MTGIVHPMSALAGKDATSPFYRSGRGAFLTDVNDHEVIDGFSGLWCVNLGYAQQSVVDAASAQMAALPYGCSFFNESNGPNEALAAKLAEILPVI